MTLLPGHHLQTLLGNFENHPEYKNILGAILKYEIHCLLQRLAATGEESVVITASLVDGTQSLIGSSQGEKFLLEQGHSYSVVDNFKEHFLQFCQVQPIDVISSVKRSHSISDCSSAILSQLATPLKRIKRDDSAVPGKPSKKREKRSVCDTSSNNSTITGDENKCSLTLRSQHTRAQYGSKQTGDESEVEKTVSQLVQSIMKQSEEKEKQTVHRGRRRRSHLYGLFGTKNGRGSRSFSDRNNTQYNIASALNPVLCSEPFEAIIQPETIVKLEPDNEAEYAHATQEQIACVQDDSVQQENEEFAQSETSCEEPLDHQDQESIHCDNIAVKHNETGDLPKTDSTNEEKVDTSVVKAEVADDEEDIELPFVEEYYESRRDTENLQLKTEEKNVQNLPGGCYKASPKRPGKFNLIHRGYAYIKDKLGKGGTVYWKCGRFQCKGRVIQRGMEQIRTQDHNHSPKLEFEVDPP